MEEILFPHDKFFHGKIHPRNLLPSTPPTAHFICLIFSVHFTF